MAATLLTGGTFPNMTPQKRRVPTLTTTNWVDFSTAWNAYLNTLKATCGDALHDDMLLQLLEEVLDEGARAKLRMLREMGEAVTYHSFWSWLTCRYGADVSSTTLIELRTLKPATTGKLTSQAWSDYEGHFRLKLSRV